MGAVILALIGFGFETALLLSLEGSEEPAFTLSVFPLVGGAGGTAALEAAEERDVFKAGLGIPPLPTVLHPSPSVPSAVVFPLAAGVSTATGGGTGVAGWFKTSCPLEVALLEGLSSSSSEDTDTLLLLLTFDELSSIISIAFDV